MKKLEDLVPIELYSKNEQLSPKDVVGLGVMGKLDIFYIFDGHLLAIYDPESDSYKAQGTKNNMVADEGCIEYEYLPGDLLQVSRPPLNLLFTFNQIELIDLIKGNTPKGFNFSKMLDGRGRIVELSKLLVDPSSERQKPIETQTPEILEFSNHPSNASLKVIGLLMLHLAKSKRYAAGDAPNKSQIKELLLSLADEFNVKEYGLSKVDERLLTDALRHLETQKK